MICRDQYFESTGPPILILVHYLLANYRIIRETHKVLTIFYTFNIYTHKTAPGRFVMVCLSLLWTPSEFETPQIFI